MSEVTTFTDLIAAVTAILESHKFKRFAIFEERILSTKGQTQAFSQLLAAHHADLDYLNFQFCCYCRTSGYLRCTWLMDEAEECILNACAIVNPLLKLSLCVSVPPRQLANVLSRCPALESLELDYFRSPSERIVCSVLVVHCKQLRSLVFDAGCRLSDGDVIFLLKGLLYLKELKIHNGDRITFRTLQGIVDNQRCLDKFCCGKDFRSVDVAKFHRLAKKAGILPVPWIGLFE